MKKWEEYKIKKIKKAKEDAAQIIEDANKKAEKLIQAAEDL
jgi:vacuolar-type H+-ATPase subunit H